jgi:predicted enzyme related to lactoylglutathione lyase
MPHRLRLRSIIAAVPDLARAKQWYAEWLGIEPYFDQPFYVGFDVNGFEIGLHPEESTPSSRTGGAVGYWKVDDLDAEWRRMLAIGATSHSPAQDVGGGVRVAQVLDPFGTPIGLIEERG